MQNYCKTIGALAAASALVAGNASAGTTTSTTAPVSQPTSAVEYELHTGYSSEYLYRGINLGTSLVEVGADVKTEAAGLVMSAGAWYGTFTQLNNFDEEGAGWARNVNCYELDLYAEVAKNWGFVTTSVGYINRTYNLPWFNQDQVTSSESTQEISFGLSRDFGFLDASLTYYWGIETIQSATTEGYTELALHRTFELSPCWGLNVGTNVGYLMDDGRATAWTSKVALDWGFAEHAKLSPFVAVSVALNEQPDTLWSETKNQLVGGCMLSVSF